MAKENGFQSLEGAPKTGFYNFADVDDEFIIAIHHWLKWYKFGFTRLWDNLSLEIRMGRMTRDQATELVKQRGEEYPAEAIQKFCSWVGISLEEFQKIADSFRNKDVWHEHNGQWEVRCPLGHFIKEES